MNFVSINPATGETVETYEAMSGAETAAVIEQSAAAFATWRRTPIAERAGYLRAAARLLREDQDTLARLMAVEMGKPVREGRAEVEKCAWVCEYYAEHAADFLARLPVETDASNSFVSFQPLGAVLAVMPWNFPLWQVFRFLAPNVMAGNTGLLKHASNVCGCALAIESIIQRAGFPESVFRTLLIGSEQVARVIEHPGVAAVTLTGSTPAGRAVAEKAGACLKKTVLELGGSDPYLILDDAEIGRAAEICATSRMINGGQSCIAAKRFIVTQRNEAAFTEALVQQMQRYEMGDPLQEDILLGPQARKDLRNELHQQVRQSIDKGAQCVLGGIVPEGPGAYYPATVLTNVAPGMPAYEEELFGPIAAIISVPNEEAAIRVANDTVFGLGAAVFTTNKQRGMDIAETQLEAGACFVNAFVKSDPRLPFGGVKTSGYGRELGLFGIREFVNIKSVYLA